MKTESWKMRLAGKIAPELEREIDVYALQLELHERGELDRRTFARARARRGIAPMVARGGGAWSEKVSVRIAIPREGLAPDRLDAIAEVAEEYGDAVIHVSPRGEVRVGFVELAETPDLLRRLAAAGLNTRRPCVRVRVRTSALAGVCAAEPFDPTPHADALERYLGACTEARFVRRRMTIGFAGCAEDTWSLARFCDLGVVASLRSPGGERGFTVFAGGRLGALPRPGELLEPFVPEEELLAFCHAACRVAMDRGVRLRSLARELGARGLAQIVREAQAKLPFDPRWTSFLVNARDHVPQPVRATEPRAHVQAPESVAFELWRHTNVRRQKQRGYVAAGIALPGGDLSSRQTRRLADLVRRYSGDHLRAALDPVLLLRWVEARDLRALHDELEGIGLEARARPDTTAVIPLPSSAARP